MESLAAVRTVVPCQEQPNDAGISILNGTGIAADISSLVPYDLLAGPCFAAIFRSPHQQIDVTAITSFATFAEG